jgi:rSAM/selenodomain-associated transferase 1
MGAVAVAIMCKTPVAGQSKTRLSPPLRSDECAAISACFIRDLSATIQSLADDGGVAGCAVYTPAGSEPALRKLLPDGFGLVPQTEGDFGIRLRNGARALLDAGYTGAILVNSDSPTLPKSILRDAVAAVGQGDNVVLSPALDGGYTLIGVSQDHEELYADVAWSTSEVYRQTLQRAQRIVLPVVNVPGWYDVDDADSFRILEDELAGRRPYFAASGLIGAAAPATRRFLRERQRALAAQA